MTFPMVLLGLLPPSCFLSEQRAAQKCFSLLAIWTLLSASKTSVRFHVFSTLNQIHPSSVTICDTESTSVLQKRISLITYNYFQGCNCTISKQIWNENKNYRAWWVYQHLVTFLVTAPEIHCFAVFLPSHLIEEDTEETDAWSPAVLLSYWCCLLTRQKNIAAVHPFTSHLPVRSNFNPILRVLESAKEALFGYCNFS